MRPLGLEVADIFRQIGCDYRRDHADRLSRGQRRVMSAIECCRTAALGDHLEQCDGCGHQRVAFNSCRNRHCPKCQSLARSQWLEDRQAELLPVEYFHIVFTVPKEISAIAYQNKKVVYDILFRATAQTLRTIAADPKHLGAEIGFIAILHTWGQNLLHHPHLHCVVPGGGPSSDGQRWTACRPGFFLPVRVLSRLFRRLFLAQLHRSVDSGELHFSSSLAALQDPGAFARFLVPAARAEWVVYAKPPFGGPRRVLEYLGRYTHRVAITNSRLVKFDHGEVPSVGRTTGMGRDTGSCDCRLTSSFGASCCTFCLQDSSAFGTMASWAIVAASTSSSAVAFCSMRRRHPRRQTTNPKTTVIATSASPVFHCGTASIANTEGCCASRPGYPQRCRVDHRAPPHELAPSINTSFWCRLWPHQGQSVLKPMRHPQLPLARSQFVESIASSMCTPGYRGSHSRHPAAMSVLIHTARSIQTP